MCAHLRGNTLNVLTKTSSSQQGPLGLHIIPEENHEKYFNFNIFVVILMLPYPLHGNVFTNRSHTSFSTCGSSIFV